MKASSKGCPPPNPRLGDMNPLLNMDGGGAICIGGGIMNPENISIIK
jgi:hypothetical protein